MPGQNRTVVPFRISIWLVGMFLVILTGCNLLPAQAPVTTTPTLLILPTHTPTLMPVCTPPPCGENEAYHCPDTCPGGCGTVCATHTPTPVGEAAAEVANEPSPTPTATEISAVRFAVIGDYGQAGDILADVAGLVKGWNPDIILTTGDNNYPDGAAATIDENIGQYFGDYIHPYTGTYGSLATVNRFFPTLGNHDLNTALGKAYFDYFSLPGNERYYDFVDGPVHFFALNSDPREPDGVGRSSAQAEWLRQGLAASKTPWQIVYFHHPPYSSGVTYGSVDWMQWPFKEWGADAVFSGHEHFYERLVINEIPYFVVGSSGYQDLYWYRTQRAGSQAIYRDDHGAMLVDATAEQMTFVFETRANAIIDAYQLQAPPRAVSPGTDAEPAAPVGVQEFPDPESYSWNLVVEGLSSPVGIAFAGDGYGRLFVIEQQGLIRIVEDGQLNPKPFLDIRDRVNDENNEQGLLGLAFHPDFAQNGIFFVNYTGTQNETNVASFSVSDNPNLADRNTEKIILQIVQPYSNHNGGHLAFGPDGYLYIGTGDGGSGGDPMGNAQNLDSLLGKMLRIDVNQGDPYAIPGDNPYLDGSGAPQVWASGLRNPWRYSFDSLTGDLYLGDVGQNQWEEVSFLGAGHPGGANFGWDFWEGSHDFEGTPPEGVQMIPPIWEYEHTLGCSVTGGVVYRGSMSEWQGVYLFGDFCSGRVWGLLRDADGVWQNTLLFDTEAWITSFGEDEAGEVYLVDRSGNIYRLEEKP